MPPKVLKKPMFSKKPKSPRKVLHIGNIGQDNAYRSKVLAKRFPNFEFYGVDLKSLKDENYLKNRFFKNLLKKTNPKRFLEVPKNLKQFQKEYIEGLVQFKNNSLDLAVSDFSLGYYKKATSHKQLKILNILNFLYISSHIKNSKEYTKRTLDLLYEKLKPGGKVIIYTFYNKYNKDTKQYSSNVIKALKRYENQKISKVDMSKFDKSFRSHYFSFMGQFSDIEIYRISAEKSKININ